MNKNYIRPMKNWWLKNNFYRLYMLYEFTSVGVFVFAIIMAFGVFNLASGKDAWNNYLVWLKSPFSFVIHLLLAILMLVHTFSWFKIMPKTMPSLILFGKALPQSCITRAGWMASFVIAIIFYVICYWCQ